VLIGPSGSGKTTTLRMINRLVEPSEGRILINGQDIAALKPEKLRLSIGYTIQSVGLFPHMTVFQNVAVIPRLLRWEKPRIIKRVEEMLNLVGLKPSEYASKYPIQLSGGEAQRIGVARALAADPPILLMDEPFGALDPLNRENLQAQFSRIQKDLKKTIVLVTHDLEEAIRLADRIAVMESGKLIQYDTPNDLLNKPINKFVHDFVGNDRVLKRLSRINVKSFIKSAEMVQVDCLISHIIVSARNYKWLWVVAEDKRLLGWVDRSTMNQFATVREAMNERDASSIAISVSATLKEALSRMLGLGFKYIPVIDEKQRLIGELRLADIEAATIEAED